MPLNPPSYKGQDVWYSPDTFVNQVEVALYQPPQLRGIPANDLAKMRASIDVGEDFQFQDNEAIGANQSQAFNQKMIGAGLTTQEDADRLESANGSGSSGSSNYGGNNIKPVSNDTQGVENQKNFNGSMQLSRNFTLDQLTRQGLIVCNDYWNRNGVIKKTGTGGLTPGQLVANAKLLSVNCLDLIRDRFPDMRINSCIRPANGRSQHGKFQACDFSRMQAGPKSHYETAIWVMNNTPFDQLILEYGYRQSWIHVSYQPNPPDRGNFKVGVARLVGSNTQFLHTGGLVNLDSQMGIA